MKQKLRTILPIFAILMAATLPIAVAPQASAVDCAILPASWCGDKSEAGVTNLLKLGVNVLTAIVGIAAVAVFVYAGIMYASARDKADQVSRAKNMMTQAIIGIVLYGLMFFVIQWLLPGGIS